jgi:hypothetical protein
LPRTTSVARQSDLRDERKTTKNDESDPPTHWLPEKRSLRPMSFIYASNALNS